MTEYVYSATDAQGGEVSGRITAASVAEGVMILESQGLSVRSIAAADFQSDGEHGSTVDSVKLPIGVTASSLDVHFQSIIHGRDSLLPGLRALASELPIGRARRDLERLIDQLSEARDGADLRESETVIRWLPLLVSGFSADSGPQRMSDLIAYASRDLQTRTERHWVLAYPIVVMLASLLVLGMMSLMVMPIYESMFTEFGLQLPGPTVALIEFSRIIRGESPRMLMGILVAAALAYFAVRAWTHYALTTRCFGFMINGNSASVSAMSTLTGHLAELLQIGVALPDAIWIAGQSCEHYHFKKSSQQLARDAQERLRPLSQSSVARAFPANVIHALDAYDGQPRVSLLRALSTMYAERVHRRVDWSTGALAQFSILLLGIAIAFMVVALMMPMVSLVTGLS